MHELSIAAAIVAVATEHADGRPVAKVEVKIGRLRQVVPDALTLAFELAAEGTPVAGAELEVEHVPATIRCRACGREATIDDFPLACRGCGAFEVDVVVGEELTVEALELEGRPLTGARR